MLAVEFREFTTVAHFQLKLIKIMLNILVVSSLSNLTQCTFDVTFTA